MRPGDDLASLLLEAALRQDIVFHQEDLLVVTHKIVSKAEGRLVDLRQVNPSPLAVSWSQEFGKDPRVVELVLQESRRIVKMDRGILIAETRQGFICANAGVDASNVEGAEVALLQPLDPDASARRLRDQIQQRQGAQLGIIITDTFGRPWREGLTNVAIGVAGLQPLRDYRGQADPSGHTLQVTVLAVADELASAAELVMGKLERTPAALIQGYRFQAGQGSARELVRNPSLDLFR